MTRFEPVKKSPGYVLLTHYPLQYLRTRLEDEGAVQLDRLHSEYHHPLAADIWRVRKNEHQPDDVAANAWLVDLAITELAEWVEVADDLVALKNGYTVEDLRHDGQPIIRMPGRTERVFNEPFNPHMTLGTFAENIRATSRDDLSELRQSMEAFGWIDHHPAIIDEHDVVLVGHRRLKVAEELGIKPQIVRVNLGSDDPADAERLKLALGSNLGNRPLSAIDRKKIAMRLYGEENWTMQRIADMIGVSQRTISEDLRNLEVSLNSPKPVKRGRPKGSTTKKPKAPPLPQTTATALAAAKELASQGEEPTRPKVKAITGLSENSAQRGIEVWRGIEETLSSEALTLLREAWERASEEDRETFHAEICHKGLEDG